MQCSYIYLNININEEESQTNESEKVNVCEIRCDFLNISVQSVHPFKKEAKLLSCLKFISALFKGKFSTYYELDEHFRTSKNPLDIIGIKRRNV